MEEVKETKNMTTKYAAFAILLLVIAGGAYFAVKSINKPPTPQPVLGASTQRPGGPPSMSGQKFSDSKLSGQAVQIYPGPVSESAKATMSGWNLVTTSLPDGSTRADLIPVGSEATEGDTGHSYVLKTGDKLYFADLNPGDDGSAEDQNTRDDVGIVVNADGIIQ